MRISNRAKARIGLLTAITGVLVIAAVAIALLAGVPVGGHGIAAIVDGLGAVVFGTITRRIYRDAP